MIHYTTIRSTKLEINKSRNNVTWITEKLERKKIETDKGKLQ